MILYVHKAKKKVRIAFSSNQRKLIHTNFLQPLQLTAPQPPSSFPHRNNLSSSLEASNTHFHSQNGHSSKPINPACIISFCCSNLSYNSYNLTERIRFSSEGGKGKEHEEGWIHAREELWAPSCVAA